MKIVEVGCALVQILKSLATNVPFDHWIFGWIALSGWMPGSSRLIGYISTRKTRGANFMFIALDRRMDAIIGS